MNLGSLRDLMNAMQHIPRAMANPSAETARIWDAVIPARMTMNPIAASKNMAYIGTPYLLVLENTKGKLPSFAMIWMVLAVARKALWMIMTIPAMSRMTAMSPPISPKSVLAMGIRVEAPASSIPAWPRVPYMQNAITKYMNRQRSPQAVRALGTSFSGCLYSAP